MAVSAKFVQPVSPTASILKKRVKPKAFGFTKTRCYTQWGVLLTGSIHKEEKLPPLFVTAGLAESFDSRKGRDEISSDALLNKLRALTRDGSNRYHQAAEKYQCASERLQGRKIAADWLEMELDVGIAFFMSIEHI